MLAPTILIVDDNPKDCYLLSVAIWRSHPQADILVAQTRSEFEARIAQQYFDCVIVDFHLRGCCGDELLSILKERCPHSAAILVSADPAQHVVVKGLRGGCMDFVSKYDAYSGKALGERIDAVVEALRAVRQERRQQQRRIDLLQRMAEIDPLTGLYNRRGMELMFAEDSRPHAFDRRGKTCIVLLDLDHFKSINDTYGHNCGDEVLNQVGHILSKAGAADYRASRWGGEEFLVILSSTTLAEGVAWTERLREAIAEHRFHFEGRDVRITASAGIVEVASTSITQAAIHQADDALYVAKRHGRNRLCAWKMAAFAEFVRLHQTGDVLESLGLVLQPSAGLASSVQQTHTSDHSEAVSRTAVRIGEHLGLDLPELKRVRVAGLCHDLGLLLVPDEVLSKPGPLSDAEIHLIGRHAEDGALMTEMLGGDLETVNLVRWHHAPFRASASNGSIPLGARILAVADAYVAMTSDRVYRPARSAEEALGEIRRMGGQQFDPAVADAVIAEFDPAGVRAGQLVTGQRTIGAPGIFQVVDAPFGVAGPAGSRADGGLRSRGNFVRIQTVNTPTILIVDDNPKDCYLLSVAIWRTLPQADILTVHTRAEFEARISRQDFDCVVVDYHLEGCCGDELISILKERCPNSAAIVVSADPDPKLVTEGLKNGCIGFVSKYDAYTQRILGERLGAVLSALRDARAAGSGDEGRGLAAAGRD